jgi:23S rRNA (cytosine1962-C5)-methyltransferase
MATPLKLTARAMRRLRQGQLWIYRDELTGARPELHGGIVEVKDPEGNFFGFGFFSGESKIAVRLLTRSAQLPDRVFFKEKIRRAGLKRKAKILPHTAVRLVNAESDFIPGLVVDWYAGQVVAQCLIPGVDKLCEMFAEILWEEFNPHGLRFRNDAAGREMEGLPLEKIFWRGKDAPEVVIEEAGVKYLINLTEGHKTGSYLDQAENHVRASEYASGRCLDAFCFQGGFALHLAKKADEVVAVDSSEPALSVLEKNLGLNRITNVMRIRENIFDILPEMARQGDKFKLIVLDPPPFAKSKKDLASATKGYYELNRRAISLLEPEGVLITYSCSFNFSLSELLETVQRAAAEQGRQARLLEIHTQAKDHPVLLSMPETFYLKGLVLEVD